MKNLNLRSWMLILAFSFIFLGNATATNYIVSGAAYQDCNGLYVETETWNDKPLYIFNSNESFAICWQDGKWLLGIWSNDIGIVMTWYWNYSEIYQCPTGGWDGHQNPAPTVTMAGKALSYSSSLFNENNGNVGGIANTIGIIYNGFDGDALTGDVGDNFISTYKVTVSNVPAGLTASIIKTANNQLTFSLTGNATNHTVQDNIDNITVTFNDDAFGQGNASGVSNYNKSDIEIHFNLFSGGSGTIDNPFLISNKSDLRNLSETNDPDNLWKKHFIQTADISFVDSDFIEGGDFCNNGKGWIPIGNYAIPFNGTYNGQNHTISGLFVNRPSANDQGFFGWITESESKIENLGVIDVDVSGSEYSGGLVGVITLGTISNCYSTGDVSGNRWIGGMVGYASDGIIINCHSAGNVNGNNGTIGGLVGSNMSTITSSYSTANVLGNGADYGGLVGYNDGSISNCYSTGNVSGLEMCGGLVGQNYSNISNSYATGNVTRTSGTNGYFGGFVGCNENYTSITKCYSTGSVSYSGATNPTNKGFAGYVFGGSFSNCFWDTETSGQTTTAGTATGKTTTEMKAETTFTSAGWDFTAPADWEIDGINNNGYPYLEWQIFSKTWDGSESTDWNTSANWGGNSIPTLGYDVIIPSGGNQPIINAGVGANCNNLTVNSGATLTIKSGGSLITSGSVSNSGTVNIEHSMSDGRWHMVSSPVEGATANVFFGDYLQYFDETLATDNYVDISSETTPLNACQGYSWRNYSKSNFTFSGTPFTGNQSITTTADNTYGWNLVGNPYPSSLDWSVLNGTYGAVYTFSDNGVNSGWGVYNNGGVNNGSQYLAPMQGFFISTASAGSFAVTNAARTHEGAEGYVKSSKELDNYVKLVVSSNTLSDELFIQFGENYLPGFDRIHDAWKMGSEYNDYLLLFTKTADGNLCIDRRPESESIQLGIKYKENIQASISVAESADLPFIQLEDTKLNQFHNLSNGAYSFNWNPADSEERFILHLKATGTNDLDAQAPQVYSAGNRVYVRGGELNSYSEMAVYDLRGRVIVKKILSATNLQSFELNQPSGVYLVQLRGESGTESYKIVL